MKCKDWAPGWLSRLSIQLGLRSWSHGLWVPAPRRALCWQLRAWSLFRILCLPLSLFLPSSVSLCLSLSKINKHLKKVLKQICHYLLMIRFFIKTTQSHFDINHLQYYESLVILMDLKLYKGQLPFHTTVINYGKEER